MNRHLTKIIVLVFGFNLLLAYPVNGCDDTLIMLLTEKNPTSEFSKSIRKFMNNLTVLGTTLKYKTKEDYSDELKPVLETWLEFSKKYMTNPPEEAKNDRNWVQKMSSTAKKIGEIRKQIQDKKYLDAHNSVLELSNTIGTFFESVGITNEKKIFITASADINDLQRFISEKSDSKISEKIINLKQDLEEFKKLITADDISSASDTAILIDSVSQAYANNISQEELDSIINKLRTSFEELRSKILMKEWFSDNDTNEER